MDEINQLSSKEEFVKVQKRKALKRKAVQAENAVVNQSTSIDVANSSAVKRPAFPPIKREKLECGAEMRKISVPAHRYSPLKENWLKIFTPVVEHLHLQIRFNLKNRQVEIRTCKETEDIGGNHYFSITIFKVFLLNFFSNSKSSEGSRLCESLYMWL